MLSICRCFVNFFKGFKGNLCCSIWSQIFLPTNGLNFHDPWTPNNTQILIYMLHNTILDYGILMCSLSQMRIETYHILVYAPCSSVRHTTITMPCYIAFSAPRPEIVVFTISFFLTFIAPNCFLVGVFKSLSYLNFIPQSSHLSLAQSFFLW